MPSRFSLYKRPSFSLLISFSYCLTSIISVHCTRVYPPSLSCSFYSIYNLCTFGSHCTSVNPPLLLSPSLTVLTTFKVCARSWRSAILSVGRCERKTFIYIYIYIYMHIYLSRCICLCVYVYVYIYIYIYIYICMYLYM